MFLNFVYIFVSSPKIIILLQKLDVFIKKRNEIKKSIEKPSGKNFTRNIHIALHGTEPCAFLAILSIS